MTNLERNDTPFSSWSDAAALDRGERPRAIRALLEDRGIASERVIESFVRMLDLPIFVIAAERVARALERAGSPDRAILALEDCVASLEESRGDASPVFVDPILKLVVELAGASGRAARLLSRDPALAIEIGARFKRYEQTGEAGSGEAFRRIVEAARGDTSELDRLIRRYRNRRMLVIALRELREGDVKATARELADLAAEAIEAALLHHGPLLESQLGKPDPPCTHVVFGMGKLGGRELNFSSDVDLMYFYEHDDGRAGRHSLHEFHVKLFERVTASIASVTEHGVVFRVDLDLRPEGRSGPIANSLASAERYYETWGRTWERAAWIKGRPIAGNAALGERVLAAMRPFVYRKSFDLKAIEEIFDMKTKIDAARKRAQASTIHSGLDLKLGAGGIREIEFFVQAYQLVHGGRDPTVRHENTLEALQRLEAAGHVNARTCELLSDAYLFLRKVEHRVQIVEEQQTHHVPSDPEAARSVARSLGFASADEMLEVLGKYMHAVHGLFAGMVGAAKEDEPIPPEVDAVLDASLGREARIEALTRAGARDPVAALTSLERASMHPRSPFHPHADPQRRAAALRFLGECWNSPSIDRAMRHLPDLIRSLLIHESYLEGLERPNLRRGVARVLGASDLLARILVSSPALLPRVLLGDALPSRDALERDLDLRVEEAKGDTELLLSTLRGIKQEEILRTAMADLADVIDTPQVGERLSTLAELLIQAALRLAELEMVSRYGAPVGSDRAPPELAVVAGGTLGAREMGYRTDLDLSFIYSGDGETTGAERAPITCGEFYTRVAQRLLSFLTLRTREGDLYPVDMRLRPSGNQGALVVRLQNFESYHEKTAQLWERQALLRARTVAGTPNLRGRVDAAILRAAYAGPVEDAARRIHEMLLRVQRERSTPFRMRVPGGGAEAARAGTGPDLGDTAADLSGAGRGAVLDLKLGEGGLVEIEFLVQYLLIQHGASLPDIRSTSTRAALIQMANARILPMSRAKRLVRAYDNLRALQNWLRIAHDEMIDHVDLRGASLRPLARAIGYQGENAQKLLERDLLSDTAAVHLCYTEVLRP